MLKCENKISVYLKKYSIRSGTFNDPTLPKILCPFREFSFIFVTHLLIMITAVYINVINYC